MHVSDARGAVDSQRLHEHASHGGVKAKLQQWTPLFLLANQLILAAGIKDFFFAHLTKTEFVFKVWSLTLGPKHPDPMGTLPQRK